MPFLKRALPSLRKRIAKLMWPGGRGVTKWEGVLYLLNLNDWHGKAITQWGPPESEQRHYFLEKIREHKSDVFIDIGANAGVYTAFIALKAGIGHVIAFEPDRRNYDRLRAHLFLNGLADTVETRLEAVSDRNGTVAFRHMHDQEFFSRVDAAGDQSVPAVRLDDALPLKNRRIAIKIDIEGHELAALEGMKALLQSNDCLMQVECWKESAPSFIATMTNLGYKLIHRLGDEHYFARSAAP